MEQIDFNSYFDTNYALSVVKSLAKKKVISQLTATHYSLMITDRNYFLSILSKKASLYESQSIYNPKMVGKERLLPLIPCPSVFGISFFDYAAPAYIIMDLVFLNEVFCNGLSFDVVISNIKMFSDMNDALNNNARTQSSMFSLWDSGATILSESLILALKTYCVDHFKVTKEVSDLMIGTAISEKVPSAMVMPTRRVTYIEVPLDSGLKVHNDITGWHDLESITIFRDDYEANSGATAFFSSEMKKLTGITEEKPFTRITFYFTGRPHEGSLCYDDATLYINILISNDQLPLISAISEALLSDYKMDPILSSMMLSVTDKPLELIHDNHNENTIKLVRYASSIMLFVNSNYARKEIVSLMPSTQDKNIRSLETIQTYSRGENSLIEVP